METEELRPIDLAFDGTEMSVADLKETLRRATLKFNDMRPGLEGFARAVTGKPKLRLRVEWGKASWTNGDDIWVSPPLILGNEERHTKSLCSRRNRYGESACRACAVSDIVLSRLLHEISHIAGASFTPVKDNDRVWAMRRLLSSGTRFSDKAIEKSITEAIRMGKHWKEIANLVSPYLPALVEIFEDVRVDQAFGRVRPGAFRMRRADLIHRQEDGMASVGPGGEIVTLTYGSMRLNSQLVVAVYNAAMESLSTLVYDDYVVQVVHTQEVQDFIERLSEMRSVRDSFNAAFEFLEMGKGFGFFQDAESEESGDDSREPESSESASDPMSGSDMPESFSSKPQSGSSGSGDNSGDDSGDSSTQGAGDETGEDEDDSTEGGSSGESEDSAPMTAMGDDASGSSDSSSDNGSEEDDDDSEEDEDDGDADSDSEDDQEADPSGDDENASPTPNDGEVDSSSGDESGEGDSDLESDSSSDHDGEEDDGDPGESSDESDHDDSESDAEVEDDDSSNDSESDDAEEYDEEGYEEDGESEDFGDGDDFDESDDDESDTDGEVESEHSDGEGDDQEETLEPPQAREWGTPEDLDRDFEDIAHQTSAVTEVVDDDDRDTLIAASQQFDGQLISFGTLRKNMCGIRISRPGALIVDKSGVLQSRAWTHDYGKIERSKESLGISGDFAPNPADVARLTGRVRPIFDANRRSRNTRNLRSGDVAGAMLARRVPFNDDRVFQKKRRPGKRSYAVGLGIDLSGSTAGTNLVLLKQCALVMADALNGLPGVKFAVWGHSANYTENAMLTYDFSEMYTDIYVAKEWSEPWTGSARKAVTSFGPDAGNCDGHTLEFYRKQLEARRETDKILFYFTDGQMPLENYQEELEVLQENIKLCERSGIQLIGVGINTDSPKKHGLDTVIVNGPSDVHLVCDKLAIRLTS